MPMPVCLPMQIASPVHEVRVSGALMKMMVLLRMNTMNMVLVDAERDEYDAG